MVKSAAGATTLPRTEQILLAARSILERDGRHGMTMRAIATALDIRAPSLYKHFPDKAAVEVELIEIGLKEWGEALAAGLDHADDPVIGMGLAYREYAKSHEHLYRLMTEGELPRHRMRPGVEEKAAAAVGEVFRDPDLARAGWAFAHGMSILELDRRFPPGADLDAAWFSGLKAFSKQVAAPHSDQ